MLLHFFSEIIVSFVVFSCAKINQNHACDYYNNKIPTVDQKQSFLSELRPYAASTDSLPVACNDNGDDSYV